MEARAGRGADDLVVLTLGIGVGGGLVLGGRSTAASPSSGMSSSSPTGRPARETAPGAATSRRSRPGTPADRAAEKLWGEGANAELLVGRAQEGDPAALEALSGMGHLLGAAIGSWVNTFAPEVVIVGGGFGIAAFEFIAPSATEIACRETVVDALAVRIVRAELGSEAGLIGACLLAFEALGAG